MTPNNVQRLLEVTSRIATEKDPYVEMYYYMKMKEREQTPQEMRRMGIVNFISYKEKEELAKQQVFQQIKKKLFVQLNGSLGCPEIHTGRSQIKQLDVGIIMRDDETSVEETHLKVLASIEVGISLVYECSWVLPVF